MPKLNAFYHKAGFPASESIHFSGNSLYLFSARKFCYDNRIMARTASRRHIVVALWMGNASGRDILAGVLRYAREHPMGQVTLLQLPNDFSPALLDRIQADGVGGIITSYTDNRHVKALAEATSAPLVTIGPPQPISRPLGGTVDFIERGDIEIGALAARHFLSLGNFNSYGYVQDIDSPDKPTFGREQGFRQTLEAAGRTCESYSAFKAPHAKNDLNRLGLWLRSLPKPAAILCFYDPVAVQLLNVCRDCGFDVPSQVSVLGIDNDEFLCESAEPPLSSVQPDHEQLGYLAAQHLADLLTHRKKPRKQGRLKHRLVIRETTRPMAPSANLVRRALDFIRKNAENGIGVSDVVAHLGVSRRLADLRFNGLEHRTIRQAIEERRMEIAVQRLKTTDWPVGRVSASCGYADIRVFEAAFRRRFKTSPWQFRERNG